MPIAVPLIAAGVGAAGTAYAANQASRGQRQAAAASQAGADQATAEQRRQYDLSRQDMQPWMQAGGGALAQLSRLYGLNQPQGGQPGAQSLPAGAGASGIGGFAPVQGGGRVLGGMNLEMMTAGDGSGPQTLPGMGASPQVQTTFQDPSALAAQSGQPQAGGQFDTFWQSPDYQFRQNEQARALTARNAALGIQDSGAAQRSALQLSGNLASSEYSNYANRLAALAGVGQTAAQSNAQLGQNYAGAVGNIAMNNADNLASSYQNRAAINGQFGQQLAGIGTGILGRYF